MQHLVGAMCSEAPMPSTMLLGTTLTALQAAARHNKEGTGCNQWYQRNCGLRPVGAVCHLSMVAAVVGSMLPSEYAAVFADARTLGCI
jgi:hypothetical protein